MNLWLKFSCLRGHPSYPPRASLGTLSRVLNDRNERPGHYVCHERADDDDGWSSSVYIRDEVGDRDDDAFKPANCPLCGGTWRPLDEEKKKQAERVYPTCMRAPPTELYLLVVQWLQVTTDLSICPLRVCVCASSLSLSLFSSRCCV